MARRIMFVQQKSGYDIDVGPMWIGWVEFTRTWRTARTHGRVLRRFQGIDSNFYDADTGRVVLGVRAEAGSDRRAPRPRETPVDEDAREAYEAFLRGAQLPGRENG